MSDALTLHLQFLSDWHVGEGAGARGQIDAIVRRHPTDGLPYVPAKTLTGILRDGCERVAYGLDAGQEDGHWHTLLREVFGSNQEDKVDRMARTARLTVGAARLPGDLRKGILDTDGMTEALVFIKPGVKLDTQGVAQSQMLRFEEVVLAGAQLHAPLTLNQLTGARRDCALALLTAGAQAVERLGAKRRRGNGRCTLKLVGWANAGQLIELLKSTPPSTAMAEPDRAHMLTDPAVIPGDGGQWRVIALDLDLNYPVIVPAETLGNVVTTQDHIPGSLLLPALDVWLRGLLADQTTSALASGAVQVRNAYPSANQQRLLPVPASLFKLKEDEETINQLKDEAPDKRQRKQLRAGYVAADAVFEVPGRVAKVDTIAVTHATIADETQRPTGAVGGVFTYQAIRPGQRLMAELWISRALCADDTKFKDWLDGAPEQVLRIGRAKKDDYGQVAIAAYREIKPPVPDTDPESLTVWLVSPLLLRDAALAPVTDVAGLAEQLGVALGLGSAGLQPRRDHQGVFLRPWRDEGWNNAWQMRRATRFGIAAGSCVSFAVHGSLDPRTLARVQANGLGERRGEGYGELRFNTPLLANPDVICRALNLDRPVAEATGNATVTDFSRAVQRRAARLAIRRKAAERAHSFRRDLGWTSGASSLPPNTQLGALRALMESAHDQTGLERIAAWLAAVQRTKTRSVKWPEATQARLQQHLDADSTTIWGTLDLVTGPLALPGHDQEALTQEMRVEAVKTLWLTAISAQLNENNRAPDNREKPQESGHGA